MKQCLYYEMKSSFCYFYILKVSSLNAIHDIKSSKSENNNFTIHRVAKVKMAKGESLQSR